MNDEAIKKLLEEMAGTMAVADQVFGTHRGIMLALECFARAQAALAPDPAALLAMYARTTAVSDANLVTLPLSNEAENEARKAFDATKEVFERELRARLG